MRILLIGAILSLAACSTQEAVVPSGYSLRTYINVKPTSMAPTTAWSEAERGGAAIREQSYHHVVGRQNVSELKDLSPEPVISLDPATSIQRTTKIVSYSVYEMQRWERFCGQGKMNARDWEFVATQGRENIPFHLIADCKSPSYTRQDYLDAWKASCHGGKTSPAQKLIRAATIPPSNFCKL